MNISRFETKVEAAAASGEALNKLLLENKDAPVLLLLSGGSSLSILDYVNTSSLGENLTITMLDERFSQEAEANNFLQFQKFDFYSRTQEVDVNFIGTVPRQDENINDLRARWEITLKKWLDENPDGKIFATIGMGSDGHIAGIFPYAHDPNFFETTFEDHHLLAAYKALGKHKYEDRVTSTLPLLKRIDEAVVFICGTEKKPKLDELLKGQSQPHTLPAVGIFETKHFQIFTDIK